MFMCKRKHKWDKIIIGHDHGESDKSVISAHTHTHTECNVRADA